MTIFAERFDARENGCGSFARDTLISDGFQQRFVNAVAFVQLERELADIGNQAPQALIRLRQMLVRFQVIEREYNFFVHCCVTEYRCSQFFA